MEKKEVKKWQDEEALRRYRIIAPLLDPDMDEGKRQQLREEAAEKNGISKRTLYRYEKSYREEGMTTWPEGTWSLYVPPRQKKGKGKRNGWGKLW